MIVFAYPSLRAKMHNSFEMTHRFMGWTVTALVWAQVSTAEPRSRLLTNLLRHVHRLSALLTTIAILGKHWDMPLVIQRLSGLLLFSRPLSSFLG